MNCTNCGDSINSEDTRYEQVTPIESGGQTTDEFCSISCLNENAGFSQEEIESLMRQAGYDIEPDYDRDWYAVVDPEGKSASAEPEGNHYIAFELVDGDYSVEMMWDEKEAIYEVIVFKFTGSDYEQEEITHTGTTERAISHARDYMTQIENGSL